jgi:hypothetical protein
MRSRILQVVGAAVLAEGVASILFLPSCGVLSSGQCADKATCDELEGGAWPNAPDVSIERTEPQIAEGGDVPSDNTADTSRADAVNEKLAADGSNERENVGHDVGTIDASSDATDATLGDVNADMGVDASIDAFDDVPADAIYMGDTAACGPCTNACVASFVQCCTLDGGCGCIEFFFPVACL